MRIVPDASTSISIELQNGRRSEWSLRGPLARSEERRFTSPATLIGVRMRPGVACLVSGLAAHTLVGRRIKLSAIEACRTFIANPQTPQIPAQLIDALERFLIERLRNASVPDVVARALDEIQRGHGSRRVAEIAACSGVSVRHLSRLMRDWVGYGPKRFANIVRFQQTLKQIERSPERSSAVLALETGYFDQSHLTSAMGRFAGTTPRHLASTSVADFSKTFCDDTP